MKIVINRDYGGFSISKKAAEFMAERGHEIAKLELKESEGEEWFGFGYVSGISEDGYKRDDKDLVAAVETLGEEANGRSSCLEVVDIPDNIEWYIESYDGLEHVAETHRTWY